jgi:opacity protein-like surface antigen
LLSLGVAILALLLPSASHAAEHWYVGLGLGAGSYSTDEFTNACNDLGLDCSMDEVDVAVKGLGGYKFNPHISVELGYSVWGEIKANEAATGATVFAFEAKGFSLVAIPELPLSEHFSLFGELGVARVNTTTEVGAETAPAEVVGRFESDEWAPVYGIGLAWNLRKWSFRLQWERLDVDSGLDLDGVSLASPKLDQVALSVLFRF